MAFHRITPLLTILTLILGASLPALGKNLDGRVGVGVTLPEFDSLGALSLRYHPSPYFTVQGIFGFDTVGRSSATVLGGRIYRNAYLEENMNFFVGLGGLVLADKGGTANVTTGIEIDALFGGELFLAGLPNLGLLFETGLGLRSLRETSVRSLGNGLAGIGIHYYF